jgi:dihydropyrimidinase
VRSARKVVIRGARRIEHRAEDPLDILVVGELIAGIASAGELTAPEVVDASGLLVMPGVIDAHVHPIHDETFESVGSAAPFGGVTTVLLHLYPEWSEPYPDAIARMVEGASRGRADFGAHVRLTPDRLGEDLGEIIAAGGLSAKVFLAHIDPAVQMTLGDLSIAMSKCAKAKIPVIVHAELGEVINALNSIGTATVDSLEDLSNLRSDLIEAAAVDAAAAIAVSTGCTLYVPHISSAQALLAATRARHESGPPVWTETCPHYLFLDAGEDLGGLGRVLPPLRAHGDVIALRCAVADGTVDVVGSDHCGHGPASKQKSDVAGSKAGLPGVELLSPLLVDAVLGEGWLSGKRLVSVLASRPAELFGLTHKGQLAPGYDADLVLIDPEASWTVGRERLHDASFYSPYEGRKLRGEVCQVWRRGERIVDDHMPTGAMPGQHLRRSS